MTALLYGLDLSHYVVKVKRILEYKGIPYDYEYAPYNDRQDLLAVSGQDYVPYLLIEDKGVAWYDIPDHLEQLKPTPTIYPAGCRNLARIVEHWAHSIVEEAVWKCVAPDARKTFKDPKEAWVFEEMQRRSRGDLDVMATKKAGYLKDLVATMQSVEDRLAESPYVIGREPSLADFALYGALHPLPFCGNEIPKALPKINEWYARVAKLGAK